MDSLAKKTFFYKYLLTQSDLLDPPTKPKVRTHLVRDVEAGQRLDNVLLRELKGVPKSHVYRIVRDGQVRVNGGRSRPATRICSGDRIRIPPLRVSSPGNSPGEVRDSRFQPDLLFEDRDLFIIDKPPGIAVHGGTGQRVSVIEQLRLSNSGFLELVHRLDKETSGILMLAKNMDTLRQMHNRLRRVDPRSEVRKSYQALLVGRWQGGPGPFVNVSKRYVGTGVRNVPELRQKAVKRKVSLRPWKSWNTIL